MKKIHPDELFCSYRYWKLLLERIVAGELICTGQLTNEQLRNMLERCPAYDLVYLLKTAFPGQREEITVIFEKVKKTAFYD